MRAVNMQPIFEELAKRFTAWFDSRHPARPAREFRELVQQLRLSADGVVFMWSDEESRKIGYKELRQRHDD